MPAVSYLQAVHDALQEEMRRDDRVFIMGEDVAFNMLGATGGFLEEFGAERVRNTPITEAGFTGAAAGAAMVGMRPVVDLMLSSFMYVAMDQIISIISKSTYLYGGQASLPLTIRASMFYGGSNAAQHSDRPLALFMASPGLKIVAPSTPYDAKGLIKSAMRGEDPVIFAMHKMQTGARGEAGGPDDLVPFGQAAIRRPGRDVTVVTYGVMAPKSLAAAERLAADGIEAEIIDLRTLMPLDLDTVEASVRRTRTLVVAAEDYRHGHLRDDLQRWGA